MSVVDPSSASILAELAFTRPGDVVVDDDGRRRARTLSPAEMQDPEAHDRRRCRIHDCARLPDFRPELAVHGFDRVDLGGRPGLGAALERARAAGRVDAATAAAIRRGLVGRALPLASGGRLRILLIAGEGFLMRKAGPGARRHGDGERGGINGHDAAVAVHADQDVDGTPLRQLLRGLAPRIFCHDSPGHHNARSRIFLVNLWIGLDQVTRPLALMDARTLDRRAHQLRYGLPTDAFLARRPDRRVNDIWTFLHDDAQRWYFSSELDARSAHVFATLSAPHGAFVVPGEAWAGARYDQVTAAVDALARGDLGGARAALEDQRADGPWEAPATASLQRAIAAVEASIDEGRVRLADGPAEGETLAAWARRAAAAADRLVRKSIEMRAVVLVSPARRMER